MLSPFQTQSRRSGSTTCASLTPAKGTRPSRESRLFFDSGEFIGQLGAGKSAIVSLLARVCEPDTTEIRVKIDADAKSQPEALQVEVRLRTGHNVTQQAILTRLISDAYESYHESVDSFWDISVPLSKE
jgi:ABC-type polysaccharide/polyol phosphate transport system ATPase subunit